MKKLKPKIFTILRRKWKQDNVGKKRAPLIEGKVSINQFREVSLLDLLGREEIILDKSSINNFIKGKRASSPVLKNGTEAKAWEILKG